MKRLLLLAALVAPLWGCAQPAEAPANANLSTNANVPAATPTTSPAMSAADTVITDREKAIWDAIKRGDSAAVSGMLADEFVLIGNDGIYDKKRTLDSLKTFKPTEVTFADWKVVSVDKDAAVVTYTVTAKGTSNGRPIPETPARSSSLWINRGGTWVGMYHQETDVHTAAAPPPAAPASGTAKDANANTPGSDNANATDRASGGGSAETADPVTKEKHLWDELKRKNWDAFASDLADNAIEVEPEGTFDKAGSIAGVKNVDFTKYTLSDWKQLKIDDDATLVYYMVKGGEYKQGAHHATIWAKRGDRWLALFHQGTPIMPMPPPPPAAK